MIVTIDGPTASGKSSVAQAVAKNVHFYYLNTGMLYRAVTYLLVNHLGYTQQSLQQVQVEDLIVCTDPQVLQYRYDSGEGVTITYHADSITQFLKDASIDMLVCVISPQPLVREHLSMVQRAIAAHNNVVIEGRDTGSVVFPAAEHKFYLTASLSVRAVRWQKDQAKQGNMYTFEEAQERVMFRDMRDQSRNHSPLIIAAGAQVVDNSELNFDQTVEIITKKIVGDVA